MYQQNYTCKTCNSSKARIREYTIPRGSNYMSVKDVICDSCFRKLMMNAPQWYGVEPIQLELKAIKNMDNYFQEQAIEFDIPYQKIFEGIIDEKWFEISNFRIETGVEVLNALKKQLKSFIARFEAIPDETLSTEQFKQKRNAIRNLEERYQKIGNDGNKALVWIERIKEDITSRQDLLEELQHASTQNSQKSTSGHSLKPLKGKKVFISGRKEELIKERNAVNTFLTNEGAIVWCFEQLSSESAATKQCREWARTCDIYIGIYGSFYGTPINEDGNLSPTEIEFNEAKNHNKIMIITIKEGTKDLRQEEFIQRIRNWRTGVMAPSFKNVNNLLTIIKTSLQERLPDIYTLKIRKARDSSNFPQIQDDRKIGVSVDKNKD